MNDRKIGDLVDASGVTLGLAPGDLVSDILVIAKVLRPDGQVTVCVGHSEGMDWLTQLGMANVTAAFITGRGYNKEAM